MVVWTTTRAATATRPGPSRLAFVSPATLPVQTRGDLGLPCLHWSTVGPNSSDPFAIQSYKYKDSAAVSGLCSSVVLKRTKLIEATCGGLPYDLIAGADQGVVHAVLTLGQLRSCTSFADFDGRDGSAGLRFQGKDAPAPESCPSP
jgi:hypothetical protein